MRTFRFRNGSGVYLDLNDPGVAGFLYTPAGLGFEIDTEYSLLDSQWVEIHSEDSQKDVTGTMIFGGVGPDGTYYEPYTISRVFLNYVRNAGSELYLEYTTPVGTYYKKVKLVSYEKGEIDTNSVLQVAITLRSLSLWTVERSPSVAFDPTVGEGVRFGAYNSSSGAGGSDVGFYFDDTGRTLLFNDYGDGYVELNNDGSVEAAFSVDFHAPISSPIIILKNINGTEINRVEFPVSVATGNRLIYSNSGSENGPYCYYGTTAQIENFLNTGDTTGLTNVALSFDVTTGNANFFKLPIGQSRLYFDTSNHSSITSQINLKTYRYYRVV